MTLYRIWVQWRSGGEATGLSSVESHRTRACVPEYLGTMPPSETLAVVASGEAVGVWVEYAGTATVGRALAQAGGLAGA